MVEEYRSKRKLFPPAFHKRLSRTKAERDTDYAMLRSACMHPLQDLW